MEDEEKLPCIDCITFPICKQYLNTKRLVFMFRSSRLVRLARKCEILNEYLDDIACKNMPIYNLDSNNDRMIKAMEYFNIAQDSPTMYWKRIDISHYVQS